MIGKLWASFARDGVPTSDSKNELVHWPQFSMSDDRNIILTPEATTLQGMQLETGWRKHSCSILDPVIFSSD